MAREPADPTERDPNLARLRAALDALDEPAWCTGVQAAPALAIELGRERRAATDRGLATWLTRNAEPAPFGHAGRTKVDPAIRKTLRVKQRGKARVDGLALDAIVERIEQALGTDRRIVATLLDVLVYPRGAKFVTHKDTPRTGDQLGTLIVEVPWQHAGGALKLDDGATKQTVAWGGKPRRASVRWVALFGDVDHAIEPVTSGARITLVYTLALGAEPRTDAELAARLVALADAIITLVGEGAPAKPPQPWYDTGKAPKQKPIYLLPCARLIVAPTKGAPTIETLRGRDRAIAETFARCGIPVRVCELLLPQEEEQATAAFPNQFYAAREIAKPIPADRFEASMLSLTTKGSSEYGDAGSIVKIGRYLDDRWIRRDDNGGFIVRKGARATVAYVGYFSETGYFGNEASDGYVYRCAALEVDFSATPKTTKPTKRRKR